MRTWVTALLVTACLGGAAVASPTAQQPGGSGTVAIRASQTRLGLLDRSGRPVDGRGTSIAVIDTGVDPMHPALLLPDGTSKVVRSLSVVPCVAQQAISSNLSCVTDVPPTVPTDAAQGGHGTFIAGVAVGNPMTLPDGTRVGGVAPGARVVMLSSTTALQGIDVAFAWVLAHHRKPCGEGVPAATCPPIRVLSLSWGADDPVIAGLEKALVAEGVTVVWANGNSGGDGSTSNSNPDPAANPTPGILTIAGYDDGGTGSRSGHLSPTSSRGAKADPRTWPDLSAPGENVTSSCRAWFAVCDAVGSSPRNGPGPTDVATYWTGSGTSWAAPHVAGVIAQLLQVRPDATPAVLDAVLKKTAWRYRDGAPYQRVGRWFGSFDKGAGLVDAYAAALCLGARRR